MDHGIIRRDQIIADDFAVFGTEDRGNLADGGGKFARPQIGGWRVDQIAGQINRLDCGRHAVPVAILRPAQFGARFFTFFVALKYITGQRPAQCRHLTRAWRRITGQTILTRRQGIGGGSVIPDRLVVFDAEHSRFDLTPRPRQHRDRASLAFVAAALQPGLLVRRTRRQPAFKVIDLDNMQGKMVTRGFNQRNDCGLFCHWESSY